MGSAARSLNERYGLRARGPRPDGRLAPLLWVALLATLSVPALAGAHAVTPVVTNVVTNAVVAEVVAGVTVGRGAVADVAAAVTMTPYSTTADPSTFIQGAALELNAARDTVDSVNGALRAMQSYRVNTAVVYGLEDWDTVGSNARKDSLFATLGQLGMKIVVRVECYDPGSFAFRTADVDWVADRYRALIGYVADPARSAAVAYFAIIMPLDDPAVQQRLGGVNSALSITRQQEYATTVVSRLRGMLGQAGFGSAPLRLGVFYGWDGAYAVPSYAASRPDGYFINNYSYPDGAVPGPSATDEVLINQRGLRQIIDRFNSQYGGASLVVEYGIHTVEYNGGVQPVQTAGLVTTLAAKQRALLVTTTFYRGYGNVAGTSYFGFNLIKNEGNATDVIDWALQYP
jgi:hypothetical protein